jgi:hypothetical protein
MPRERIQGYLAHKKPPRALWKPSGGGLFLMGEVPEGGDVVGVGGEEDLVEPSLTPDPLAPEGVAASQLVK